MKKIYLVEDDKNLNLILSSYLEKEGFLVSSFLNGLDAKENIPNPPDLWILDIMLPDIDGYRLIKEIKNITPGVPIIFISARDAEIDRVLGLELGCDDYLPKPFLPRELVIRTKNILSRYEEDTPKQREINNYDIDKTSRKVSKDGQDITLTSKEYELLLYFLDHIGLALSREQILQALWEDDYFGSDRVVDDLVRRLRGKMEDLNIKTLYGYGYRMENYEE